MYPEAYLLIFISVSDTAFPTFTKFGHGTVQIIHVPLYAQN